MNLIKMIIALNGSIGVGKTYISNQFVKEFNFEKYEVAKPLKDIGLILGFEEHQLFGTQQQKLEVNKKWGISGRTFLQKFGTEICRDALPIIIPEMKNLWIQCMDNYVKENKLYIIDGLRFEDEFKWVKERGGYVVKITSNFEFKEGDNQHSSEQDSNKIIADIHIINNRKTNCAEEIIDKITELKLNKFK